MKIALFNVKFSPNLGDGFMSECLENGLRQAIPGCEVTAYDISGRRSYGGSSVRWRKQALGLLQQLPAFARRLAVRSALTSKTAKFTREWVEALADVDVAVIGGGHLFQDDDLNFAMKIAALARACRMSGTPVCVYAVGVTQKWSREAESLFRLLGGCEVRFVSVRDIASSIAWSRYFQGLPFAEASICPDPGLLARATYGAAAPPSSAPGAKIVIGVAHPLVLKHHSTTDVAGVFPSPVGFYAELARVLRGKGFEVSFFTNGAEEDEHHLDAVMGYLGEEPYARHPRPLIPSDLHGVIAGADAVVAHRLHANIVACALGRPSVGLAWDRKLEDFLRSVTPAPRALPLATADMDGATVAAMLIKTMRDGIDPRATMAAITRASDGILALANAFPVADGTVTDALKGPEDEGVYA